MLAETKPQTPDPNTPDGPMTSRRLRVQMVGGSGVGKTCFVAGLALLNERTGGHSFVLPTDNATKAMFDSLRATLENGQWPEKSNLLSSLSFAIQGQQRIDVVLTDFAGEHFLESMKRGDESEAARQVQRLVDEADLLVVMLDGSLVDAGEPFADAPLIQAVFQRFEAASTDNLEIMVLLTKRDLCVTTPVATDRQLKRIVAQRAPDLERYLRERNVPTHWVAVTVCGPDATTEWGAPIYQRLAPEGYERFFDVVFAHGVAGRRQAHKRFLFKAMLVVIVVLLTAGGWHQWRQHRIISEGEFIADPQTDVTAIGGTIAPENRTAVRERYEREFRQAKEAIDRSGNVAAVALELARFDRLDEATEVIVADGLRDLRRHADRRQERLLFNAVIDAESQHSGGLDQAIKRYLDRHPNGEHAEQVRAMLGNIRQARYLTARGQVKASPVTSRTALAKRVDAIGEFLKVHGDALETDEKTAITRARDVAAELLQTRQYRCKLIRSAGLDLPRHHGVEIRIDGQTIANFDDSGKVREKNWNRNLTVTWQAGQAIQVKLVNYSGSNQDMAYFENVSPVAIVLLAEKSEPSRYATNPNRVFGGTDFTQTRPGFRIEFSCQELPPDKLAAIHDYILPGDAW